MPNQDEIFFEWARKPVIACNFARRLAKDPVKFKWKSYVVPTDVEISEQLANHIQLVLADSVEEKYEAIQLLFPKVKTDSDIVDLIRSLCSHKSWYCGQVSWDDGDEKALLVGLRWILPDDKNVNWVLGFAEIDTMPATRHGPFTALVLRTGNPGRCPKIHNPDAGRKIENSRTVVHLADMEPGLSDEQVRNVWERTEENRLIEVKQEWLPAARATVTFSLPLDAKDKLSGIFTEFVISK